MNIQEIITPFSKKDFSSKIILDSRGNSFKSLDKEFQAILKNEFSDVIRKYKEKVGNSSK